MSSGLEPYPYSPLTCNLTTYHFDRISIYSTKTNYYLIGRDVRKIQYRIIKIDRTIPDRVEIVQYAGKYTKEQISFLINSLHSINKPTGGINKLTSCAAILGFVRFSAHFYLVFAQHRLQVGLLGRHAIYSPSDIICEPIPDCNNREISTLYPHEEFYKKLFFNFDPKDFFYSPTYDLSATLQSNFITSNARYLAKEKSQSNKKYGPYPPYRKTFVWNHTWLQPLIQASINFVWLTPIIHGAFAQRIFNVISLKLKITLLARRSRFFAGTRFLKRGCNERGECANDVELEQIICDSSLTFNYFLSSFVHCRGSIPLFWSHQFNTIPSKLIVVMGKSDPYYRATTLHFMDLMHRYGSPIIILNLLNINELTPRESILGSAFKEAIDFINSSIPSDELKLIYIPWDFKQAIKNGVFDQIYAIAEMILEKTGFFCISRRCIRDWTHRQYHPPTTDAPPSLSSLQDFLDHCQFQSGTVRSNCLDSIDRTNVTQFFISLCAISHQLHALGVISNPNDLDLNAEFSLMFLDLVEVIGHKLALQYGGSGLAHTVNSFATKSMIHIGADVFHFMQRRYNNIFTDQRKQQSIDLFLGVIKPWKLGLKTMPIAQLTQIGHHLHMVNRESELLYRLDWWLEPLDKWRMTSHRDAFQRFNPILLNFFQEHIDDANLLDLESTMDSFCNHYQTHKYSFFGQLLSQCWYIGDLKPFSVFVKTKKRDPIHHDQSPLQPIHDDDQSPLHSSEEITRWLPIEMPASLQLYQHYMDIPFMISQMYKRKKYIVYIEQLKVIHHKQPKILNQGYISNHCNLDFYQSMINKWKNQEFELHHQDDIPYQSYLESWQRQD